MTASPMTSPSGFGILDQSSIDSRIPENCIRFVCMSDTHSMVEYTDYIKSVPYGDVLLHAGDFTDYGEVCQYVDFNKFLGELPHPIKLVTPGNHDVTLDPRGIANHAHRMRKDLKLPFCGDAPSEENYKIVVDTLVELVSNAKMLMDAWVSICGIKIYGYPWVPKHGVPGFGLKDQSVVSAKQEWIPDDVNILLSHGPVKGYGDLTKSKRHVGCPVLQETVALRIKPKVVVCGHIHEGKGVYTDGVTTYINAAVCNRAYRPVNMPYVFDYKLPSGYTRHHLEQLRQRKLTVNKCAQ